MTNKQAVKVLRDLWRYKDSKYSKKEIREALDIAIDHIEGTKGMRKIIQGFIQSEYWITEVSDMHFNSTSETRKEYQKLIDKEFAHCGIGAKTEGGKMYLFKA